MFMAAEPAAVVETVATGGATGKPIFIGLTANDIERLAFSQALSFHSMGLSSEDRALLLMGMDRWSLAAMGYYRGLMLLGVNIGRAGPSTPDLCRQYCESFKPSVLLAAPSTLRRMTIDMIKASFHTNESGVTRIVCTGESLKKQDMAMNALGTRLQECQGLCFLLHHRNRRFLRRMRRAKGRAYPS